jgi:hypothetical protein
MAKPRVFVASTFYDLRTIRTELENFIRQVGYEPVLFEKSGVPYPSTKTIEDACHAEIDRCDILVAIIGGAFGTSSGKGSGSISNSELRHAVKSGKQVHIYVQRSVFDEHRFWCRNKEKAEYETDTKVFAFLDEVFTLPSTPPIPFDVSQHITEHLREQWAGVFQELLSTKMQLKQQAAVQALEDIAQKLQRELTKLSSGAGFAVNNPYILRIRQVLGVHFRAYILNRKEFNAWLESLGFDEGTWDDDFEVEVFTGTKGVLRIKTSEIFTEKGTGELVQAPHFLPDAITFEEKKSDPFSDDFPF